MLAATFVVSFECPTVHGERTQDFWLDHCLSGVMVSVKNEAVVVAVGQRDVLRIFPQIREGHAATFHGEKAGVPEIE